MHETVTRPMIVPEYLTDFRCIGPACEDNCCQSRWNIDIDKAAFHALKKTTDPVLAPLVRTGITRNRSANASEQNYARIPFNEARHGCLMFSDESWCSVHARLGEKALSDVCATYPRYTICIDGVWQQAATPSCPEVARRAFLPTEPMHFVEHTLTVRQSTVKTLTLPESDAGPLQDARFFALNLLQHRDIPLWQRLTLLGEFCWQADRLRDNQQGEQLPALIEQISSVLANPGWADPLMAVTPDYSLRMNLCCGFLANKVDKAISRHYDTLFSEAMTGLGIDSTFDVARSARRYQAALEIGARDFLDCHAHVLEHLLVNQLFLNAFPIIKTHGPHWFDGYLWLVAKLNLARTLWVGLYARLGEKLDTPLALACIQTLERNYQHNLGTQSWCVENLKLHQLHDLATLTGWLKE
ncbi:flagellin lysine-N-methylase [Laribacter hongkongensis]|uniref:flagellin lysine-N-methylase n=1 Tax=Laribacter hongkongensis TaxID=168471 RepID=UPI001EFDBABD|nr:flagellin lysine-N-methylase [Laribacter hongkongensis]MCG9107403.1 flagellin lysine-N-methylase [Laribacter hongkongensis]